jgi:adenylosuccinate synthase
VLDGLKKIKICTGYKLGMKKLDYLPSAASLQKKVQPIYETLEGWSGSTVGARSWLDLPPNAIKYVRRIEELIGCTASLVSTSPERDDTILVRDPFEH